MTQKPKKSSSPGDSLFLLEGKQDEPCTIVLGANGHIQMDMGELEFEYIIEALEELIIKLREVDNVRDN